MQLVVLAAGHGRRFGGLKQLASVGRDGEALMDFTAADAVAAGFDGVVLIVREEVQDELLAHIRKYWPPGLEVRPVIQGPIAGTAQAVASAREAVTGSFGVVNADDLYGRAAISLLHQEIRGLPDRTHSIIGYRLADTVLTDAPVTRGICETSPGGELVRIVEQQVVRQDDRFSGKAIGACDDEAPHALSSAEVVSMNLWGFDGSIFEDLDRALAGFDPDTAPHQPGKPPELLLPVVVGELVAAGSVSVRVAQASGRCIGITHPDDLPLVRDMVAKERYGPPD
ncbi:MAG: NTP transferase domain-containing protein [Acidimicrobiales bacterium]